MNRSIVKFSPLFATIALSVSYVFAFQDAAAPAKLPLEHTLGTVTKLDASAHSITVKDDKTGAEQTVLVGETKTLLKVEPGAKDLKSAVRITADDLQVGDRVDVRGLKTEAEHTLAARSVVLMSGRDLQKAHQEQAAAWQHSTAGLVSSVDAAAGKITITTRTADGPKPVTLETSKATEFTRYAIVNPKVPAASQISEIQTGDQIRVIGDKSDDGSTIKAQKIYSGAFRTLSATVSAISPDGKSLTVKDLATKKPVELSLTDDSAIRKLPPQMAAMLARRFNPSYRPDSAAGQGNAPSGGQTPGGGQASANWQRPAGAPSAGAGGPGGPGAGGGNWQGGSGGPGGPGGGGGGMRSGDISQMLDRLPKVQIADLKVGDALVVSGVAAGADNSHLVANSLIAGVEPILQSAPQRQGQLGGDWGLGEMSVPQ